MWWLLRISCEQNFYELCQCHCCGQKIQFVVGHVTPSNMKADNLSAQRRSRAVAASGRWSSIYWIKTFSTIFDMKKTRGTSFSETALWCCSLKHCHFCIGIIGRTILPAFLIPLVNMLYLVLGTTPQDRILIAPKLTELLKFDPRLNLKGLYLITANCKTC